MVEIGNRQIDTPLPIERIASIAIRLWKVRLKLNSAVEVTQRRVRLAARHVSHASIVIGVCVFRPELNGLAVIANGTRHCAFAA